MRKTAELLLGIPGIQRAVLIVCLTGGVVGISAIALAQVVAVWRQDEWMIALLSAHYPALVCLPIATFVSLVIVVLLEARYDEIRMELFNGLLKFEGASGPIILWDDLLLEYRCIRQAAVVI